MGKYRKTITLDGNDDRIENVEKLIQEYKEAHRHASFKDSIVVIFEVEEV